MADNISQIKERLNIVDVISGYLKVQKSGMNFKARCPFHNEKSASFYISPERQIWHCFGCQKGGDMFSFIQEIEGAEFVEALSILAQKAGVQLERYDSGVKDEKAVLFEICETSTRFFEKQLHHSSVGKKAVAYLKDRGLDDNTIKEFRLGFAPEGWHNIGNFLRDCGYNDSDIVSSGVAIKKDGGGDIHDRFRSRIMFPIADINDRVVGFTGRIFEDPNAEPEFVGHHSMEPGAKYINTPQTSVYDKSRVLYGLNKAKTETRRLDRCLLVEGNIDAIMSYQAGVKNVAATSGTALTPSHLQLLQRYTNNLDFCFDTDQAGLTATRRGIGLALSQNFNIKIVHLHEADCKDPADYVRKFGQKWQEVATSAKPVIEFYFDKLRSELDLSSVDGKKAVISSLGPLIKRLASQVERSHWISRLAAILKTKEDAVNADISMVKDDLDVYVSAPENLPSRNLTPEIHSPSDLLLEALLAVVLKNPQLIGKELETINSELIGSEAAEIINAIKQEKLDNFDFSNFSKKFEDSQRMRLEFAHLKAQEFLKDFGDDELRAEFYNLKDKIERKSISARLASLESDIKEAEATNNKNKLSALLNKFNDLAKELKK